MYLNNNKRYKMFIQKKEILIRGWLPEEIIFILEIFLSLLQCN